MSQRLFETEGLLQCFVYRLLHRSIPLKWLQRLFRNFFKTRSANMKKTITPGSIAPRSGQWELIGPRGGHTGQEVTVVKGKPMPPTSRPNMSYTLVDPTKHKSGT